MIKKIIFALLITTLVGQAATPTFSEVTVVGSGSLLTVAQSGSTGQTYIGMVNPGLDGNTIVKGRLGYVHAGTTSAGEHDSSLWRAVTLSINESVDSVGASIPDDPTRSTYRHQYEWEFDGNAYPITTITTGTTTRIQTTGMGSVGLITAGGGVAVDYVDGSAGAVLNNKRFLVVSAASENDFYIAADTSGLTATVTGSSCVFFPQNEWNITSGNRRVWHMAHFVAGNKLQGYVSALMPLRVDIPAGWLKGTASSVAVSDPETAGIDLFNTGTTSRRSYIRFQSSGSTFTFGTDRTSANLNNLFIYDGANNLIGWSGGNTIIGALPTTDDGANRLQVTGNTKFTGDIAVTGTATGPFTVVDSAGSVGVRTTSNNIGLNARRSSVTNGSGGTTVVSFSTSGTAAPTTFTDFLRFAANLTAGVPTIAYVIAPSGVTSLQFGVNGAANTMILGAGQLEVPSLYTTAGTIATDAAAISIAKPLRLTVAGMGIQIKEGGNAKSGTATLVSGTALVSNASVSGSSRIQVTRYNKNASSALGVPGVGTVVSGTSFLIEALKPTDATVEAGDASSVAWLIVDPAP